MKKCQISGVEELRRRVLNLEKVILLLEIGIIALALWVFMPILRLLF